MTRDEKLTALNAALNRCKHSSFYRDRLPDKDLISFEELKRLPLTTKQDLRDNSPFGLVCVPHKELYQYHESFGTTGTPVSHWLTKEDMRSNAHNINSGGINFSKDDTVLVRFPYALSTIAHYVHKAAQSKGACVIPASSWSTITPLTRILNLMQKLEVTVLTCLPLQALLLAETAEMIGLNPSKDFPKLRAIFTAGELLTEGKRKLLENIWNAQMINNYGMTEVGSLVNDCEFSCPHPAENDFIFEILKDDLETDVKPGEIGNLVVTTINKQASPIIRFLTGDRAEKINVECPCGTETSIRIRGRNRDTINIASQRLDLWDLDYIASHLPYHRFWVAGPSSNGLRLVIEEEQNKTNINRKIVAELEEVYGLPISIETVPRGTIYNREQLLAVGEVGKPRYIYSEKELVQKFLSNKPQA